jgi:hypothetical protein
MKKAAFLPLSDALNCGAGGQARTDDLLFTKQLLYQLSYTGATSIL